MIGESIVMMLTTFVIGEAHIVITNSAFIDTSPY